MSRTARPKPHDDTSDGSPTAPSTRGDAEVPNASHFPAVANGFFSGERAARRARRTGRRPPPAEPGRAPATSRGAAAPDSNLRPSARPSDCTAHRRAGSIPRASRSRTREASAGTPEPRAAGARRRERVGRPRSARRRRERVAHREWVRSGAGRRRSRGRRRRERIVCVLSRCIRGSGARRAEAADAANGSARRPRRRRESPARRRGSQRTCPTPSPRLSLLRRGRA